MIGHIRKRRPRHYLQKIPIERERQTVGRHARTATARVNVIEVLAVPHDLQEVRKRVASLRQPRFIRRQVARVEVNNATRATRERTEIVLSLQKIRNYVTRAGACESARLLRGLVRVSGGT
jgi:hypothetical protein